MRSSDTGDVWWKSAVVYCADVQTFQDSDGNGQGDIKGMTDRIEYLDDLGVTVWSAKKPRSSKAEVVFPDKEDSTWELDERTGEFYLHHFYKTQPDLNVSNPRVREEIARTLGFWLRLGVSGFRIDAVPFLFATDSYPGADPSSFDPFRYLGNVRGFVTRRLGDAALLGEVNLPYSGQKDFFGGDDGDGLNLQFDFNAMQAMYLSLVRGDAGPLAATLRERPTLDITSQWANFVRNHDELTLDKLTSTERKEVFAAFGPEPDMQLFDRGLRRRLPPMLGGDQRRIRMVYSLMFSLPGTPVLFYGEEIGMGENLNVEGRLSVRTPMQWSDALNGGFSTASKRRLARPQPTDSWAPEHVNAADQRADPESLWNFIRELSRRYRQMPQLGWSDIEVLDHDSPHVLAHLCRCDDWLMLAVHNLGGSSATLRTSVGRHGTARALHDVLGDEDEVQVHPAGDVELVLAPYEGRWLRVLGPGEPAYLRAGQVLAPCDPWRGRLSLPDHRGGAGTPAWPRAAPASPASSPAPG